MNAKVLNWARLAFFVGALFLCMGILVSALISQSSTFGANEVILILAIVALGLVSYRESVTVLRAEAKNEHLDRVKSNDSIAREEAAINDVRSSENGTLIYRPKQRRTLALVVLLGVLSLPVAIIGIPASLDGRSLSVREVLLILFLEIAVVACAGIAWHRVRRVLM